MSHVTWENTPMPVLLVIDVFGGGRKDYKVQNLKSCEGLLRLCNNSGDKIKPPPFLNLV